MTSEIRANTIKNRVGLGTIEYSNTGPVISGVTTAFNFKTGTSNLHSTGLNIFDLDVDGHTNLDNVSVAGVTTFANNISLGDNDRIIFGDGGLSDAHVRYDGSHLQFGVASGAFRISADTASFVNYAGTQTLATINSTGLSIPLNLDVDGHTNLDNVSIAGVTTAAGSIVQTSGHTQLRSFSNPTSGAGMEMGYDGTRGVIQCYDRDNSGNKSLFIGGGNVGINQINPQQRLDVNGGFKVAGVIDANGDLDVDGHTNLDNVSIAGITTITKGLVMIAGASNLYQINGALSYYAADNAVYLNGAGNNGSLRLNATGSSNNRTSINLTGQSNSQADAIIFMNASSESLRITSSGYVQTKSELWVGGSAPVLRWRDTTHGEKATARISGSDLYFEVANNERLRITSSGQVGVNQSSFATSDTMFSVSETSGHCEIGIISKNDSGVVINMGDTDSYNQGRIKYDNSDNSLTFRTVGADRLRITSGGQLLMGETSAVDSNTVVQFNKNVSGGNARFIFRNNANNGSSRVRLECMTLNRAANADTFSGIEKYQSGGMHIFNGESTNQYSGISLICGGHNVFRLKNGNHSGHDCAHIQAIWGTSNGLHMEQGGAQSGTHKAIRFTTSHYGGERGYIGVTLGGTSYNSSSDYRQKQDVVDLTGAIDRVKSFKPRRFKWKDDPTYTVDGFLAHEAQTVVPESVVGDKDAVDKNGDPEYQVIDQSKLVPLLTAALQEAITEIETLKTKVAALEGS